MDRILVGFKDWREFLGGFEDNKIDLIITSPPYNLQNKGGDIVIDTYKDNKKEEDYQKEQIEFLNECYRVLKPKGALFYNHKTRYIKNKAVSPLQWILQSKLNLHQEIIWNRQTTCDYNESKFAPLDEKVYWLYKKTTFNLNKGATCFTNIWDIARPKQKDNFGHKATFPVQLIIRILISLKLDPESVIVDPFCGTGTVGQAVWNINRINIHSHICFLNDLDIKWKEIIFKKERVVCDIEDLPKIKKPYKSKTK